MATIRYYMDHHVHSAITSGLERLGIDCLTAQEDGRAQTPDDVLLERATQLGRVLFSQDLDLWNIGWDWISKGRDFAGLCIQNNTPCRLALLSTSFR